MNLEHDLTTGFTLAWKEQRLIFGALKRAGVYRSNYLYEDLVQEGYLTYALTWSNSHLTGEEFNHYVFQRIVWRTLDLLRHERYRQEHSDVDELMISDEQVGEPLFWDVQVQELLPQLTAVEQQILFKHLLQEQKLSLLAINLGVTPRYLRKVRTQLREKLRPLLGRE
ncbi:MAG: sigma-70 family RNA polymerase sigma factor [Lactobacillus sp.]|uniref:sigma-70 family RNA polymerase sigma factor n=1 Tax=Bombilactobacillus bombi TaxID=1303590 RepID=UPI0035E4F6C9|nr:sigma-70 family RNA polymerase sigma factor [Lactobacillus sp.]